MILNQNYYKIKMKQINNYIQEKLKLNKTVISNHQNTYTLFPKTKKELIKMIREEIEQNGNECSLNHIDVSNITDMSELFYTSKFNGDISEWDVSNVEDMIAMFFASSFNGDISKWDVSNVKNMSGMFHKCDFNSDISRWDVSNVKDMFGMFYSAIFNSDISKWKINPNCSILNIFYNCPIKNEYKPKSLQD